MKRFRLMWLIATCLLLATPAWSGPDRYSGDASIYEGVAQDVGRPNIMFIIDNSMATLKSVSTVEYNSSTVYDVGVSRLGNSCVGVDNANAECWQPWNIYKQDNQGDFATRVMTNATSALPTLSAGLASPACLGDRSYVLS